MIPLTTTAVSVMIPIRAERIVVTVAFTAMTIAAIAAAKVAVISQ